MKMAFEAWTDGESVVLSSSEGIEEQREKGLLSEDAKHLHTIEAESYEDAMVVHHRKMGWEPYKKFHD